MLYTSSDMAMISYFNPIQDRGDKKASTTIFPLQLLQT